MSKLTQTEIIIGIFNGTDKQLITVNIDFVPTHMYIKHVNYYNVNNNDDDEYLSLSNIFEKESIQDLEKKEFKINNLNNLFLKIQPENIEHCHFTITLVVEFRKYLGKNKIHEEDIFTYYPKTTYNFGKNILIVGDDNKKIKLLKDDLTSKLDNVEISDNLLFIDEDVLNSKSTIIIVNNDEFKKDLFDSIFVCSNNRDIINKYCVECLTDLDDNTCYLINKNNITFYQINLEYVFLE